MSPWTHDLFEPDETEPGVHFSVFVESLTTWVAMQLREPITVAEAAMAWNTTPDIIREAADATPWLFVAAGDVLHLDGE